METAHAQPAASVCVYGENSQGRACACSALAPASACACQGNGPLTKHADVLYENKQHMAQPMLHLRLRLPTARILDQAHWFFQIITNPGHTCASSSLASADETGHPIGFQILNNQCRTCACSSLLARSPASSSSSDTVLSWSVSSIACGRNRVFHQLAYSIRS